VSEATEILKAIRAGGPQATEELILVVYDELRRLAACQLAREQGTQTLQPTALVHEAYLRLVGDSKACWEGRGHFFAAATEAMRRILLENARRKKRVKRGGGWQKVAWSEPDVAASLPSEDLLALDEALDLLARTDPPAAQLVRLRFFAGLSYEEAGEILGMSRRSAFRTWAYARAWLFRRLTEAGGGSGKVASGNP